MNSSELRVKCTRLIQELTKHLFVERAEHSSPEHFGESYLVFDRYDDMQVLIATDRGSINIEILPSSRSKWLPLWWILAEIGVDKGKLISDDRYDVFIDNVISEFVLRPTAVLERANLEK